MQKRFLRDRIELRGRLVEQQKRRAKGKRAGQGDDLALTARQLGNLTAKPWLDAEEMGDFSDAATHHVLRRAEVFKAKGDFVPDGIAHDLVLGILRHVADERCRLPIIELACRLAEHRKLADAFAMRGYRGFAVAQKRGFAAAGRAHKQLERPLGDPPIERADRGARCLRVFRWRIGEFERRSLNRRQRCGFLAGLGIRLAKRRGALRNVCRVRGLSGYRSHARLSFTSRTVGNTTSSTYGI